MSLFVILGARLPDDLRALSTAQGDNARWNILQVDNEFANLAAALAEEKVATTPDSDRIRLRTDIVLSRADIVVGSPARDLLRTTPNVSNLLDAVAAYRTKAAVIIDQDGALTANDVTALKDLTSAVRPAVRELALLGLSSDTAFAEQQRTEFAGKLRRFGLVAIALLTSLVIALFYLGRLLERSQRKDSELHSSTARLTATVAASLDGVVISNASGEIIDFNTAATTIFGWTKDEIIGRKMDETIVPHQHRQAHATGMTRYLATREPHVVDAGRIELSALRKTGEEFPIELNITSASGDEGEIFIAYVRDISERKVSEKKLVDARELAERTDRAKSNFLTVMSHEMRTPLNGILGVLDLLETTDLDGQQARYVQVAAASGEILLEHVNEALDITRIESGVMSLTPEVFSLKAMVLRVADVLRTLASEKDLILTVDFDPSMDRLFFADGARVNQILTNLIGNAIKFTETGGITISVTGIHGPKQSDINLSVTDTGPGIQEEKLEDIFEDFVALAQATGRQRRGDGLGLSISRKVARLMQGDLMVVSTLGQGSTFTLSIPLERAEAQSPARTKSRIGAAATKRSILIVEDNAINRSVLKEMLIGFGHDVTEAENGLEGLKRAEKTRFDLVIMDISMPIMDGIETTRRIRESKGPNANTFILGLTAHGRQEFRIKAEAAGMDGFFTKPVRLSELRATLNGITPESTNAGIDANLSTEILDDLYAGLGSAKLNAAVAQFFDELRCGLASLRSLSTEIESPTISETLHRLRGAAVMLGLGGLASQIDRASSANANKHQDAYHSALNDMERAGTSMAEAVSAWLALPKD